MSGSTGKMTAAAIRERGPQMVLRNVYKDGRFIGQVIERDQWWSTATCMAPPNYSTRTFAKSYTAKSYTLSYLLRIAKGNRR